MRKSTKIWLCCAIVLSTATTVMNGFYGRWLSVLIAIVALAGLCFLLFTEKKVGFYLMCGCYVLAFGSGVLQGITGDTNPFISILMSFIGSAFIPLITYLFLRRDWGKLK